MKFHYQLLLLAPISLLLSSCVQPPPVNMWKCTATNARQEHWVQYSSTRIEAAVRARDRCRVGSYRPTCIVRCIPPATRWHCVAVDRDGHTWY